MVTFLNVFLPIVSLVVAMLAAIGGWSAFRLNRGQQTNAIQESAINGLKIRVDTLESEREDDKQEIATLRQVISSIRHALKLRGLHIEIENDGTNSIVTIIDSEGSSKTTQIPNPNNPMAKIRPIKLV